MTKDEFKVELKALISNISSAQKVALQKLINNIHNKYMIWTHCHKCNKSNHRIFEDFQDEYDDIKKECKRGDIRCVHCGNNVVAYCGYRNGDEAALPNRVDTLNHMKNIIKETK